MLSHDISKEYGLTGVYLIEYCGMFSEDYALLEKMDVKNPVVADLKHLYKLATLSKFILSCIPKEEIENILECVSIDFMEYWEVTGGGTVNLDDITVLEYQSLWEVVYLVLAVYLGNGEDEEQYVKPVREILFKLIENIRIASLRSMESTSLTLH